MGLLVPILILGLCCGVYFATPSEESSIFSVSDYGAIGDGCTEDTGAFLDAWSATCRTHSQNSSLVVPENSTFLVHQLTFTGPCKATSITFQIFGKIIAPTSPKAWMGLDPSRWIAFHGVDQLHITGFGTIDGRGSEWWDQSCRYHPHLATVFRKDALRSHQHASSLSNVKFVNSSQTHVLVSGCHKLNIYNLWIEALEMSPDTDGIHIQSSHHITISNTVIGTGDDCISIGDYTSGIHISNVECGPGHGISVGSLGKGGSFVHVENIHVSNVHFNHTTNGARIKTWQVLKVRLNPQVGKRHVRRLKFENLTFESIRNPIIIDQNYCFRRGACKEMQTGVQISNVAYTGLSGTSSTDVAVNLNCSQSVACTGIVLESIVLVFAYIYI